MCTYGKQKNENNTGGGGCGGIPEDFSEMMKMMDKCCPEMKRFTDCAGMMRFMKEGCRGSEKDDIERDKKPEKSSRSPR